MATMAQQGVTGNGEEKKEKGARTERKRERRGIDHQQRQVLREEEDKIEK